MAIAPVNKFITVAVPVAPGEQKIYEVPTGVSSILLYAQVSNVGVGTYPTTTLIHRRESRSTGNTRGGLFNESGDGYVRRLPKLQRSQR